MIQLRIVGVGSAVGDDAVAWRVVRELRRRLSDRTEVELLVIDSGQRLLDVLDGGGRLWLIDAVAAGAAPGTIHDFSWPDSRVQVLKPSSTHGLSAAEALQLADAVGLLPTCVRIFGIELGGLEPEAELGEEVRKAVPLLVDQIAAEITS